MNSALRLGREAYSIYEAHKSHQRYKHDDRNINGGHNHYHTNYYQDNNRRHTTMLNRLSNLERHSHSGGLPGLLVRVLLRFLQFVLALTVCGLYGVDLDAARKAHAYADSKWVYAEVCAGLSALTCLVYLLPMIKSLVFFAWDWVLFILWVAVFGVFGRMYIGEQAEYDGGITRMKHAVWVDLTNMLLWFITATYGTVLWYWNFRSFRRSRGDLEK